MKYQLISAALLMIGLSSSAQTREKTVELTKKAQLNFEVAGDGKTKEGLYYVKNLNNNNLWVQGHYKDNQPSGTWYFFNDKGVPEMRYSFDQRKLLFMDQSSLKNVSVKVLSANEEDNKKASAPLPLCSIELYSTLIGMDIYNNYNDPVNDGLVAAITAHIDEKGRATYSLAYMVKDRKSREKDIDFVSAFPIVWMPAAYEGKALPSEFTFYTKIPSKTEDTDGNFKRFDWSK